MNPVDRAAALFEEGYSCSQSVLAAFAEKYGVDLETAFKMASAFGGGMARLGETCGAVSGGLMVIGLHYGQTIASDKASKEQTYQVANELVKQFKSRHGSCLCKELLGCEIRTPVGMKFARDQNYFQTRCPEFVTTSADITASLIE